MTAALALCGCETDEVKQLARLYEESKREIAERSACAEPRGRCHHPLEVLRAEAVELERALPRAAETDEQLKKRIHDAIAKTGLSPTYKLEPETAAGDLTRHPVVVAFQGVEQEAASFVQALCSRPRVVEIRSAERKRTFPPSWEIRIEADRYVLPPAVIPPLPDAEAPDRVPPSRLSGGKAGDLRLSLRSMRGRLADLKEWPNATGFTRLREDVEHRRARATQRTAEARVSCETFRDLLRDPQVKLERIEALDRPPTRFRVSGRGTLPSNPKLAFGDAYEATLDAPPSGGTYKLVLKRR